jgi:hypothetical protein
MRSLIKNYYKDVLLVATGFKPTTVGVTGNER